MPQHIALLGAPIGIGASRPGCHLGPDRLRAAGLPAALRAEGHRVSDLGDVTIADQIPCPHPNPAVHHLAETRAWIAALEQAAHAAARACDLPVFLGGDHALSAGTVAGIARHAAELDQPLFVLWLDAHPDLHTLDTTTSGNLHGTPLAYLTGQPGCEAYPPLTVSVPADQVCIFGARSIDPAEERLIADSPLTVHRMAALHRTGVVGPLTAFLDRVRAAGGRLHVSFDVDFLDPAIAPAVGTAVPEGASAEMARQVMTLLAESRLVTSLDIVELNPLLDPDMATARRIAGLIPTLLRPAGRLRRSA